MTSAVLLERGTRFSQRGPINPAAVLSGPDETSKGSPAALAAVFRVLAQNWLGRSAKIDRLAAHFPAALSSDVELLFGGEVESVSPREDGAWHVTCAFWAKTPAGETCLTAECAASVADDPEDSLPLERLKQAVKLGEPAGTFVYRVGHNDIENFARAIGGTGMPEGVAPPTYFGALDPVERRDTDLDNFLQDLPFPKRGGGNAFNEVEYERPIRVGDVLTVTTTYTDVYEKKGSRSTLVFRVRVNEMRDENGDLVATSRCGHVLGYQIPGQETS